MPDASTITRQRLANALVAGNRFSNHTHSTMGSIQKKLRIYGDAYKNTDVGGGGGGGGVVVDVNIVRVDLEYEVKYFGTLPPYEFNTYPTLPTDVMVITVTGITGNLDGTIFVTDNTTFDYRSYWFSSPPSTSDINVCMEVAYSTGLPPDLPTNCIAVKLGDEGPTWNGNSAPTTVPVPTYVLILPYGNTTAGFQLTVRGNI